MGFDQCNRKLETQWIFVGQLWVCWSLIHHNFEKNPDGLTYRILRMSNVQLLWEGAILIDWESQLSGSNFRFICLSDGSKIHTTADGAERRRLWRRNLWHLQFGLPTTDVPLYRLMAHRVYFGLAGHVLGRTADWAWCMSVPSKYPYVIFEFLGKLEDVVKLCYVKICYRSLHKGPVAANTSIF